MKGPEPSWPRPLPPGGTIGVFAPAGPCRRGDLCRGLRALTQRGYRLKVAESCRRRWHYLAGNDDRRLADLHALVADPEVDALWCARGGYGTMRLLDRVDWALLAERRLPLIGYSDITALQLALFAQTGLISFSGPMVGTVYGYGAADGIAPETEAELFGWLTPGPANQTLENPGGAPLRWLQSGVAEGRLLGGNLSLLAALVGTPYLPDLRGAILAIEDVGEVPYRVDRMLTQLRLAGLLDQVSAALLGDFADCFPPATDEPGPAVEELLMAILGRPGIPVASGLLHGHIRRRCTLPLGAMARISEAGRITIDRDQ